MFVFIFPGFVYIANVDGPGACELHGSTCSGGRGNRMVFELVQLMRPPLEMVTEILQMELVWTRMALEVL